MASSSTAPVESESQESPPIVFTVKSANDTKYPITLASSTTVADLKTKLAELSEIPKDRQRLIYSGRVMKDEETLSYYKVQSGHTIHLVKGAASNQRAGATSSTTSTTSGASATPQIPTNIAAGSGNNPLAGLTGARYAGMAPLPNADMFGPDGGMGPPPDPEQMYSIMNTPGFQTTMNEMLQNPQMLDYIINSNPTLRSIPGAREMMQSAEFRQMMTNPDMIRQASALQRLFGRGSTGPTPSFPEPGRTDTTPDNPAANASQTGSPPGTLPAGFPPNPFAAILGVPGAPGAQGRAPWNPFFGANQGRPANPSSPTNPADPTSPGPRQSPPNPTNPPNPINPLLGQNSLLTNPSVDWSQISEVLREAYYPREGTGDGAAIPSPQPPHSFNPFAMLGLPPLGGTPAASPPPDTRPPEERYAEQLRQLNDMGFYDFDRNIEALRRTGGSVQGAIQHLLGD